MASKIARLEGTVKTLEEKVTSLKQENATLVSFHSCCVFVRGHVARVLWACGARAYVHVIKIKPYIKMGQFKTFVTTQSFMRTAIIR